MRHHLEKQCGFSPSLLKDNYPFGADQAATVPLVAFAHEPTDARSACIAVVSGMDDSQRAVAACRGLATPVVLTLAPDRLEWWKQGVREPVQKCRIAAQDVAGFFQQHGGQFRPEAIYRAKTRGRLEGTQLEFVDLGLMPLVEQEIGGKLAKLVERVVTDLRRDLRWTQPKQEQGQWLIETTFWLLAAKILHDKNVPNFRSQDLADVADVFDRVGRHYGGGAARPAIPNDRRQPLQNAAGKIKDYAPLIHVTTEALAQVYESALITNTSCRETEELELS